MSQWDSHRLFNGWALSGFAQQLASITRSSNRYSYVKNVRNVLQSESLVQGIQDLQAQNFRLGGCSTLVV